MNYLETIGTAVGLAYLWLEYRASIWLWLAGIVMPAIYIFVYYSSGFYADMAVNVYYLGAGIYGWFMWRKRGGSGEEAPIARMPLASSRRSRSLRPQCSPRQPPCWCTSPTAQCPTATVLPRR